MIEDGGSRRCAWRQLARPAGVVALLVALVVACAPRPPVEAPPPAPPEVVAPVPAPERDGLVSSRLDRFCSAVQRIVDAQEGGFVALRGQVVGGDAWSGTVVPEGLGSCTVEGQRSYVCNGPFARRGNGAMLQSSFDGLAADLDACFARAAWFPRNWHRGDLVEFAGVEQQQVWRDLSSNPRPAVALNIEEDVLARLYTLQMTVRQMR